MIDLVKEMFEKNDCREMAEYIIRTNLPESPHADLNGKEYQKLFRVVNKADAADAVYMAFLLGVARGYRLGKRMGKTA